jgi:hypothetical protein
MAQRLYGCVGYIVQKLMASQLPANDCAQAGRPFAVIFNYNHNREFMKQQ